MVPGEDSSHRLRSCRRPGPAAGERLGDMTLMEKGRCSSTCSRAGASVGFCPPSPATPQGRGIGAALLVQPHFRTSVALRRSPKQARLPSRFCLCICCSFGLEAFPHPFPSNELLLTLQNPTQMTLFGDVFPDPSETPQAVSHLASVLVRKLSQCRVIVFMSASPPRQT